MRNKYIITALTCLFALGLMFCLKNVFSETYTSKVIKAGFIYIGDTSTAYTNNFYRAQTELSEAYPENVITVSKFNVQENDEIIKAALDDLIKEDCSIIFTTSYGYKKMARLYAEKYPDIQFCQATGDDANEAPLLPNYHTFMGTIYEGRYVSGVAAGLKLQDLINRGAISRKDAKIGYVAAFPFAEVISGYTAFFLGVRSVVPEVIMSVIYTNTWSDYASEKRAAEELIEEGCTIISQHSDTTGPAIACEEAKVRNRKTVYHVGYNQSMTDVAPTTSLISCRINWTPYIISACEAMLKEKKIESVIKGNIHGTDAGAGLQYNWVEIIGQNNLILAPGTQEKLDEVVKLLKNGKISVFQGNYSGVNPENPHDTWDLNTPYLENAKLSAPSFNYVLKDVITVR